MFKEHGADMWLKSLRNSGHHPENYICWELPTYQCCTTTHSKSHWKRSRGLRCIDDLGTCSSSSIAHNVSDIGVLSTEKVITEFGGILKPVFILKGPEYNCSNVNFLLSNLLRKEYQRYIYLNVPRCARNPSSRTSPPRALLLQ